jgi:hypothetical protein
VTEVSAFLQLLKEAEPVDTWVKWCPFPKGMSVLKSLGSATVTLFRKRVFADIIKDLEMRFILNYSVDPNVMTKVLTGDRRGDPG